MPWIEADFSALDTSEVHPHFCGIDLVCITPGLKYRALAPGYRIKAQREKSTENFSVMFYKEDDSGFTQCAVLTAGLDRLSIERCIVDVVNRPSVLQFQRREDRKSWEPNEVEPPVDTEWPGRPNASEHPLKVNVYVVKPGKIYRLMSRKYKIAVWRKDYTSCFRITFWTHFNDKRRVYEAGISLSDVREFVLSAIQDPRFLVKKKNVDWRASKRMAKKYTEREKKKEELMKERRKKGLYF